MTAVAAMRESRLRSLPLVGRGKVRDIYAVGEDRLLIVQTDRVSAFDIILAEPIPEKGETLTAMSFFWFRHFANVIPNHLSAAAPESAVSGAEDRAQIAGRAMLAKKLRPLPVEAICRGYLAGSGWKEYQKTGAVCGESLPPGLRLAEKLPTAIFTPSTKAAQGEHDVNIAHQQMRSIVGAETADKIRAAALRLYKDAAAFAAKKGVIIADAKFEFALDEDNGELTLIDEALTPDSSRFWRADNWRPGENPESFDKQHVRDYLEKTNWDKTPPPPPLPKNIIAATSAKYREIRDLLLAP